MLYRIMLLWKKVEHISLKMKMILMKTDVREEKMTIMILRVTTVMAVIMTMLQKRDVRFTVLE